MRASDSGQLSYFLLEMPATLFLVRTLAHRYVWLIRQTSMHVDVSRITSLGTLLHDQTGIDVPLS